MAASFTSRIMEDGPRNAILWVQGNNGATGDPGTGGTDLAYTQLILPTALGVVDPATKQRAANLRIDKIEWDINAELSMRVDLFWDATTPNLAYSMVGRANKFFKDFGGVYSPSGLAGATGGIGISTTGAQPTQAAWTFILYLIKL